MNNNNSVLNLEELEQHEQELSAKAAKKRVKRSIPEYVFNNLPTLLKEGTDIMVEQREKELFLVGALPIVSGILPNVTGYYMDGRTEMNLFVYVTGSYGSGKGGLKHAKKLASKIHAEKREKAREAKADYKAELAEYKKDKTGERQEPERAKNTTLFLPADISKAGLIKLLNDNEGRGIFFETEGDTLTDALKREHGAFSVILRSGMMNEGLSKYLKSEDEFTEIERMTLSALISSTPDQRMRLIPKVENGLFSRFLYYTLVASHKFLNPFDRRRNRYSEKFEELSFEYKMLYDTLNELSEKIEFELTPEQADAFLKHFGSKKSEIMEYVSEDLEGVIHRLGLICFRIAMLLSTLRNYEGGWTPTGKIICTNTDFKTAMYLVDYFYNNTISTFYEMPEGKELIRREKAPKEKQDLELEKTKAKVLELAKEGMKASDIKKKLRLKQHRTTIFRWISSN